jgi:hypothetical protein
MADEKTNIFEGDRLLPEGAVVEALLEKEGEGPLKPLDDAQAEEDETGLDEVQRVDDGMKPGEKPEAEAKPDEKTPPGEKPEVTKTDAVLSEVDAVLKELAEAEKKPAPEPEKTAEPDEAPAPEHIQALLDHDDPAIQATGKALLTMHREQEARIARLEGTVQGRELDERAATFDAAVNEVAGRCEPPLTEMERDWLVDRLVEERNGDEPLIRQLMQAAAKSGATGKNIAPLTVAAGIQKLIPGRLKATNGKPDTAPKKGAEDEDRPVIAVTTERPEKPATIDSRGGSAGPKPTLTKPPADETLEQAIKRGADKLRF